MYGRCTPTQKVSVYLVCEGLRENGGADDNAPPEENDIHYVLCPESLTDDEKANPELWGWRAPEGKVEAADE